MTMMRRLGRSIDVRSSAQWRLYRRASYVSIDRSPVAATCSIRSRSVTEVGASVASHQRINLSTNVCVDAKSHQGATTKRNYCNTHTHHQLAWGRPRNHARVFSTHTPTNPTSPTDPTVPTLPTSPTNPTHPSSSPTPTDPTPTALDLNAYVHQVSSPLDDDALLRELRETTQRDWPKAEQLIDEPQSKALSFLVQLTGAQDVLEVGCFTGYSALSLANGLSSRDASHSVTTCDVNAETIAFARSFFQRSARNQQIHSVVSDGMAFLESCAAQKRQFDFIFVDANKKQYINYYNAILELQLLRPRGLLAFDNTLFRGRVLASANGDAHKKERIAHGLAAFNEQIQQDTRTVCVLLPLWDGLTLVRQRD